jgi:hypothetical protein
MHIADPACSYNIFRAALDRISAADRAALAVGIGALAAPARRRHG